MAELARFLRRHDERSVLHFQKDSSLLAISLHREELADYFDFVVPDADLVEARVDKGRFTGLALRLDLPISHTTITRGGEPGAELGESDSPVGVEPVLHPTRPLETWIPVAGLPRPAGAARQRSWPRYCPDLRSAGFSEVVQEAIAGPEDRVWRVS